MSSIPTLELPITLQLASLSDVANNPTVLALEFIDEYPRARQPLRLFDDNVLDTPELVEWLYSKYME